MKKELSNKETSLSKMQILNDFQLELQGYTVDYILGLDKEGLTDEEYKARAGDIETAYKNYLEKVLDLFIVTQMTKMAEQATDDIHLAFYRGSIASLISFKDWCKQQVSTSRSRFVKDENQIGL